MDNRSYDRNRNNSRPDFNYNRRFEPDLPSSMYPYHVQPPQTPVFAAYGHRTAETSYGYARPPQVVSEEFRACDFNVDAFTLQQSLEARRREELERNKNEYIKRLENEWKAQHPLGSKQVTLRDDSDDDEDDDVPSMIIPTMEPQKKTKKEKKKRERKSKKSKSKKFKKSKKSKKKKSKKYATSSSSSSESSSSFESSSDSDERHKKRKRKRSRSPFQSKKARTNSPEIVSILDIRKNPWKLLKMRHMAYNASHIVIDFISRSHAPISSRDLADHISLNFALDEDMKLVTWKKNEAVGQSSDERYFCRATERALSKTASERAFRQKAPLDSGIDYLPLSLIPFTVEAKAEIDAERLRSMTVDDYEALTQASNLSYECANLREKSKILHARCTKNPTDVDSWIEFINIQKPLFSLEESGHPGAIIINQKALKERIMAILQRACSANPRSVRLALEKIKILSTNGDPTAEWLKIKNLFINRPMMWQKLIETHQNERSKFNYLELVKLIDECLSHLVDIRDGVKLSHEWSPTSEHFLVEKIIHRFHLQKGAGYFDSAVATCQALTEFVFFAPSHTLQKPDKRFSASRVLLKDFEMFWTSGLPRIGDESARGWRNSLGVVPSEELVITERNQLENELTKIDELEEQMIAQFKRPEDRLSDIETWRRVEIFRSEQYWRPVRFVHDSCYLFETRICQFEEFSRMLFTFSEKTMAHELVLRVIHILGAVVPGMVCPIVALTEEFDQAAVLRRFSSEFPLMEHNYRDLNVFFDNFFDLLLTAAKDVDRERFLCAKFATRSKFLRQSTTDKKVKRRIIANWTCEVFNSDESLLGKAICFFELAKAYELHGFNDKALSAAIMIMHGIKKNIFEETNGKLRSLYLEIVRWTAQRLPFCERDAVERNLWDLKPQISNAKHQCYTPRTKYELLYAIGLNGTLDKVPTHNQNNRILENWYEQCRRKVFEPTSWYTNERECIVELTVLYLYEVSYHLMSTMTHLEKCVNGKITDMTSRLYEVKIDIYEHKMRTSTMLSPKHRNALLLEAIQRHPTHVGLLKKFIDSCRRYEVRNFLVTHPGGDGLTRRIRACGMIYLEWTNYINTMKTANSIQRSHALTALRKICETAAENLTMESDHPDDYLWCLLLYIEQEANSSIRRVDEVFALGHNQVPWSKRILFEMTKKQIDSNLLQVKLFGILNNTGIQKYTDLSEISTLYMDNVIDEEYLDAEEEEDAPKSSISEVPGKPMSTAAESLGSEDQLRFSGHTEVKVEESTSHTQRP